MTIATNENTTMASLPALNDGIALTYFIVAEDVERAAQFYGNVFGGEIVLAGEPTIVALANSWIIITSAADPQTTSQASPAKPVSPASVVVTSANIGGG
jgi:hypothetical protein